MKARVARLAAPLIAVAALLAAGTASAQYRGDPEDRYGPEYDSAQVLSVDPIIDAVSRPVSRDECWEQPVTYREPARYYGGYRDRTPALLAGIVGGVIGNQIGSGSGRDAATAAGALLGYSAARDSQRRHGGYYASGREYRTVEQRCATRTDYVRDERVTATTGLRYNGRVYHTVTTSPR